MSYSELTVRKEEECVNTTEDSGDAFEDEQPPPSRKTSHAIHVRNSVSYKSQKVIQKSMIGEIPNRPLIVPENIPQA